VSGQIGVGVGDGDGKWNHDDVPLTGYVCWLYFWHHTVMAILPLRLLQINTMVWPSLMSALEGSSR